MTKHRVLPHKEWLESRKALLAKEKEFTRLRDEMSRARRELPWEAVTKEYVFEGTGGRRTLAELFEGRSQLIVYHFMFAPSWDAGCPHCSFWADNFNGISTHLNQRDVTFVAISRAPIDTLAAYQKRMGWSFTWLSSGGTDFSYDLGASYTPDQVAAGAAIHNYETNAPPGEDEVAISVFALGEDGQIFHTYSTYGRGVDMLNGAYHYLDLVPKGRDEAGHDNPQFWVRRHDEYAN